jgi:hypothetical protein
MGGDAMTDEPQATGDCDPAPTPNPAAIMRRHLREYAPCADCLEMLEQERQAVGLLGCATAYCPHHGVHLVWHCGVVSFQLCSSRAHAEAIDRGYIAYLREMFLGGTTAASGHKH